MRILVFGMIIVCLEALPVTAYPDKTIRNNALSGAQVERTLKMPVDICIKSSKRVFASLGYVYVLENRDGLSELEMTADAVKNLKDARNVPGGKVPYMMKFSPSILLGSMIYDSDFYVEPHTLTVFTRSHSANKDKTVIYLMLERKDGKYSTKRDKTYLNRIIHYINQQKYSVLTDK